jgi:predicted metal-binding protein
MTTRKEIESIVIENGFTDYRWINPQDIVISQWVRVKCTFGCPDYGLGACPPNTPSVAECIKFFSEYSNGLIVRLIKFADKNSYPSEWSKEMTNKLLALEKQLFLKGNYKTFLLNQNCCVLCKDCSGNRVDCKDKSKSRPSPEAFAVDVYQTVKNAGMEIHVVPENPSEMSRIAILMID